jgi:hypothetical protein
MSMPEERVPDVTATLGAMVHSLREENEHMKLWVAKLPVRSKPSRKPLPAHLPREVHQHRVHTDHCPECGGALRVIGEDVSEVQWEKKTGSWPAS